VVTDKEKVAHESTVWNANDWKFPVKIETAEGGQKMVMRFKTVAFEKPAASAFELPAGIPNTPASGHDAGDHDEAVGRRTGACAGSVIF